jgi:hypothetical protein
VPPLHHRTLSEGNATHAQLRPTAGLQGRASKKNIIPWLWAMIGVSIAVLLCMAVAIFFVAWR